MKKITILTFVFFFLLISKHFFAQNKYELNEGIKKLSNDLNNYLSTTKVKTIYFETFKDDQGKTLKLSTYIKEELKNQFQQTQLYQIVETAGLANSNDAFSASGANSPDAKIEGSFIELGESVKISAKALSLKTGKILATASVEILKDNNVVSLLEQRQPMPDKKPTETPVGEQITQQPQQQKPTNQSPIKTFFPKKFTRGDLEITLTSAKREGFEIIFTFIIKNIVKDEVIYFNEGVTRLIDNDGNSHKPHKNFPYYLKLVENINHKVEIIFKSSSFSKTDIAPLLEFEIYNQAKIQIRDIPLQVVD